MGKFRQISTVMALDYVRNLFLLSFFGIFLPNFVKRCMRVDI